LNIDVKRLLLPSLLAFAVSAPLAAQQGPPGPPSREFDRGFIYAQMLRAIEAKTSLLIDQGKPDAAIEELKKVVTLDVPKDHPAFEGKAHLMGRLATTLSLQGRKKEAVETIQKLLAEVPAGSVSEVSAVVDAGQVYRNCDMPDEALKSFDRAIELSQKLAKAPPRGPAGRPGPHPPGPPPPPRN
jgi:tetratricopeptide (TPR) repeat protein